MSTRDALLLTGRNGLACLLSLLTAGLLFPVVFMLLVPDSTYGWWLLLILSGLGTIRVLLPVLFAVVVFNAVVRRAQNRFGNKSRRVMLGAGLGIFIFLYQAMHLRGDEPVLLLQSFLLTTGAGALFGFYHHALVRN